MFPLVKLDGAVRVRDSKNIAIVLRSLFDVGGGILDTGREVKLASAMEAFCAN